MSDFTDDDVTAAVDALNRYAEHHLNESRARVVLAAVVPAMRDRWLTELADEVQSKERYGSAAWTYRTSAEWLRSKRSGGDQFPKSVFPATPGAANVALDDDASCPDCGMPLVDDQHWMFGLGFRQPTDCPRSGGDQ